MSEIICFGEVLIDFLNTGMHQDGDLPLRSFTQYPGGAPANAAVAVSKLGGNAKFLGQVGHDQFGEFLIDALENYGVDTSLTLVHPTAKTALAFVLLDEQGERSFAFRRCDTADIAWHESQLNQSWFADTSVLHFCSNTLTDASITHITQKINQMARELGALISFDVNLRHNLWPDKQADRAIVNELVRNADIVKFSKEEFDYLSGGSPQNYITDILNARVDLVLITDGGNPIEIISTNWQSTISPPDCDVVDTTGGGDAFIGALLFGLAQQASVKECLNNQILVSRLVHFAAHCGAIAVSRHGAFPALPVFEDVHQVWRASND